MSHIEKFHSCVHEVFKLLKVSLEPRLFSLQANYVVVCQNTEILCAIKLLIICDSQV